MLRKIKNILLRTYRQSTNIRHLQLKLYIENRDMDIVHIAINQINSNVIIVTDTNKKFDARILDEWQLKRIYKSMV